MKKRLVIGLLATILVLWGQVVGADFYVIPVGPRVGTEIKSLPYTITAPGFYYLTKNLTATGTGITVNEDDVTIDLMGFRIIGPGSASGATGIYLKKDYVEIRNGAIRNFENGVGCYGSRKGIRILNIRAIYNGYGIDLGSATGCLVKGCTAAQNSHIGIRVSYGAMVASNIAFSNDSYGLKCGSGATVIDNTVYGNQTGIHATLGATVSRNTAYQNTADGFYIYRGSTVTNNTACDNGDYGFDLESNNLFWHNTAWDNDSGNYDGCSACTIGENYAP